MRQKFSAPLLVFTAVLVGTGIACASFWEASAETPLESTAAGSSEGDANVGAQRPVIEKPNWRRTPDGKAMAKFYPRQAVKQKLNGVVSMACGVSKIGEVGDCSVLLENPKGLGFGDAALQLSRFFEMTPMISDGRPIDGGIAVIPIVFRYPRGIDPSTPTDFGPLVQWYTKAAELGDPASQVGLGSMYEHGQGVTKDEAAAVGWYRRALGQGLLSARINILNICTAHPTVAGC